MHTVYTASFANELPVERKDTRPLMSWSRAFVSAGIPVTNNPMAYLGRMPSPLDPPLNVSVILRSLVGEHLFFAADD